MTTKDRLITCISTYPYNSEEVSGLYDFLIEGKRFPVSLTQSTRVDRYPDPLTHFNRPLDQDSTVGTADIATDYNTVILDFNVSMTHHRMLPSKLAMGMISGRQWDDNGLLGWIAANLMGPDENYIDFNAVSDWCRIIRQFQHLMTYYNDTMSIASIEYPYGSGTLDFDIEDAVAEGFSMSAYVVNLYRVGLEPLQ